jgi:hypothetical protein
LDRGDHRPRQTDNLKHRLAAQAHHVPEVRAATVGVAAPARKLFEVVAGTEGRAVGGDHDRADGLIRGNFGQGIGQRSQHCL